MGKVADYWMNEYSKDKSIDMIENIEQKLDKMIELLEKLVPQPINISSPISVTNKEGSNVDINKHLYDLVAKVQRRTKVVEPGKEEFISRVKEIDWTKIPGAKISLLDEKGKDVGVKCEIQKDGSVVCEPITKETGAVYWGLKKEEDISNLDTQVKLNLLPKVVPAIPNKKFITKTIDVFKQQVESNMFVYVGTMTDNVLTLDKPVKEVYISKPSTYFTGWFVKNTNPELGCQWLDVHPTNHITHILLKDTYFTNVLTTGYVTDEGKAVYYDQYL